MAKYCILMFALAGIMSVNVQAADKIAGCREKTGVHVPSGTVTETDNVILSGDGEFYKPDVCTFLRRWSLEGPTHHFALGVGHHAAELKKLGKALGIETVVVTEE